LVKLGLVSGVNHDRDSKDSLMTNPNIQLNRILERESLRLSLKRQSKGTNHVSEEGDGCSDLIFARTNAINGQSCGMVKSHRDRLRLAQGQILEEEPEEDDRCGKVVRIGDEGEGSKSQLDGGQRNWTNDQEVNALTQQINGKNRYFGLEQLGHPSTYRNLAKNNKNFNAPRHPQTPTGQKTTPNTCKGAMKAYNHTRRFFSTFTNTVELMNQIDP
jgi:hypothetical protein